MNREYSKPITWGGLDNSGYSQICNIYLQICEGGFWVVISLIHKDSGGAHIIFSILDLLKAVLISLASFMYLKQNPNILPFRLACVLMKIICCCFMIHHIHIYVYVFIISQNFCFQYYTCMLHTNLKKITTFLYICLCAYIYTRTHTFSTLLKNIYILQSLLLMYAYMPILMMHVCCVCKCVRLCARVCVYLRKCIIVCVYIW